MALYWPGRYLARQQHGKANTLNTQDLFPGRKLLRGILLAAINFALSLSLAKFRFQIPVPRAGSGHSINSRWLRYCLGQ